MYAPHAGLDTTLPGEPSPKALHREEYYHSRAEHAATDDRDPDPQAARRASLLRAYVVTRVGRFFV